MSRSDIKMIQMWAEAVKKEADRLAHLRGVDSDIRDYLNDIALNADGLMNDLEFFQKEGR